MHFKNSAKTEVPQICSRIPQRLLFKKNSFQNQVTKCLLPKKVWQQWQMKRDRLWAPARPLPEVGRRNLVSSGLRVKCSNDVHINDFVFRQSVG